MTPCRRPLMREGFCRRRGYSKLHPRDMVYSEGEDDSGEEDEDRMSCDALHWCLVYGRCLARTSIITSRRHIRCPRTLSDEEIRRVCPASRLARSDDKVSRMSCLRSSSFVAPSMSGEFAIIHSSSLDAPGKKHSHLLSPYGFSLVSLW